MNKLKTLKDLTYFKLMDDIVEIAKFKLWDTDEGDKKAQEIIDEIHNGKYGDKQGLWVQYDNALDDLKKEAIKWIKELEQKTKIQNLNKDTLLEYISIYGKIDFIKHFFDITNENL